MDWNRYAEFLQRCIELVTDKDKKNATRDIVSDYRRVASAISAGQLRDHPILNALVSPTDQPASADAPAVDLRQLFFLDPAQDAAVRAAMAGNPITVIEGPPGCGKSQAVAALMYECWVRGKSALFVSSTNSAVEVVLERLRSRTGQHWILLRHGKWGKSDLEPGWEALSAMGGKSSRPRLPCFPAPDGGEARDIAEFERFRVQLEGYEPETIDEALRTIAGEVARCAELRSEDVRLEREHRLKCRFGDLEPMDPAEARRMHDCCRAWIGSFVELGLQISDSQAQRRLLLSEAEARRTEAMGVALHARGAGAPPPEARELGAVHDMLARAEASLQGLRLGMKHATISPLGASADREMAALSEADLADRMRRLADVIRHVQHVMGTRTYEKRALFGRLADEHRRLCEAIRTPDLPKECLDEVFQRELKVRWQSFHEAVAWLELCAADRPAVRLLPFSRWRKARRRLEACRFELLMHASSIRPPHGADGQPGGKVALDGVLLESVPWMLRAHELAKGKIAQESLAHHAGKLLKEAQDARIASPETGWSLDDLPAVKQHSEKWYAEIRSRLARRRLASAAGELRSISSHMRSAGLRSEGVGAVTDLVDRFSRGIKADEPLPERFLGSIIDEAESMMRALEASECAARAAEAIRTPADMHAAWLGERPDRPGNPDGVPALAEDATATGAYHGMLDDWAASIDDWERRREERRAMSASLADVRQRARDAVDTIALTVAPEFGRRARQLTNAPDPADWDIDEIRKTVAGFTPAYLERQREAARSRIIDRERQRIKRAMECGVGARERSALDRLARMPPRRRASDDGDAAADALDVDSFRTGLQAAPLIVTTTNKTFDRIPMVEQVFDVLIVDEASRTSLIHALPGMIRARAVVVIGDPNQLPPIERDTAPKVEKAARDCGLDLDDIPTQLRNPFVSLYESAARASRDADFPPIGLTNHYRSHPAIIGFSNQNIYRHQLTLKRHPQPSQPYSPAGVFAVDLRGTPERDGSPNAARGSTRNVPQAEWIVRQLESLTRANPTAKYGVVTLHRAQKELLDQLVEEARSERRIPAGVDCLVGTVDTFQGSERDHVFYNIASDMSDENQAAWAEDPRRVNVAVTRARQSLTIVADLAAIRGTGKLLAQLVHHADVCNDLRRTNRGAHELYAWMLIDGIPLLSDPECAPDEETVTFRVRNRQGLSIAIAVVPQAGHAPPRAGDGMPMHCFVGKDIMRSPRGAAARLRRLLELAEGESPAAPSP
jgi:hypothetical protein